MSDNIRGIEAKHEHSAQQLARDTRPLGERFAEFISTPTANFVVALSGIACCFIFPQVADIIFVFCASLF
jgi:hypothetical protein